MLVRLYSVLIILIVSGCGALLNTTGTTTQTLPPYDIEIVRAVNTNSTLYLDISLTQNSIFNGPVYLRAIGLDNEGVAVTSNKIEVVPSHEHKANNQSKYEATIYTITLPAENLKRYKVELEWGINPAQLPVEIIRQDKNCSLNPVDCPNCCIITGIIKISLSGSDILVNQREVVLSIAMPGSNQPELVTVPIYSDTDGRFSQLEMEQTSTDPNSTFVMPIVFLQN